LCRTIFRTDEQAVFRIFLLSLRKTAYSISRLKAKVIASDEGRYLFVEDKELQVWNWEQSFTLNGTSLFSWRC